MSKSKTRKRSTPLTISVGDEHFEALDEIISCDPMFPPTRSEIAALSVLFLRDKIREGKVTLLDVYQTYAVSDVEGNCHTTQFGG